MLKRELKCFKFHRLTSSQLVINALRVASLPANGVDCEHIRPLIRSLLSGIFENHKWAGGHFSYFIT